MSPPLPAWRPQSTRIPGPRAVTADRLTFQLIGERIRVECHAGEATLSAAKTGALCGRVRLEDRGDTLFVECLVVDQDRRGYGLGSEAARLIREFAAAQSWRWLRAWAPPDRGLAVYFWSRMGLRPVHGPGPDGGLLFERDLQAHSAS